MKTTSLLLSCLLISASCSKGIGKPNSGSFEEAATTSITYEELKSKDLTETRVKQFNILVEREADMPERMDAAGQYFESLDFQSSKDPEALPQLYLSAATEFTDLMNELYARVNPDKMNPQGKNKKQMSFYALAASLDIKKDEVSFYDLMKSALLKEHQQKSLLDHEFVLTNGLNKEMMVDLIKARVDIFAALALKNITDKRSMKLGKKTKAFIFRLTKGRLGSIHYPDIYDTTDRETRISIEEFLKASLEAKNFLKEIAVEKRIERTLHSAFKNLDLEDNQDEKSEEDEQKTKIRNHISNLLG